MPGAMSGTDGVGGLLDGLRVLDLSIWRPGPYATQLLAEIGADVVKLEPPGGDPMRIYADLFASLNANKRSVVLDLKTKPGRDRAMQLAVEADAIVEGFRPGVASRLGMGYDEVRSVNPTIIYCSISGMGQRGELADVPGHDLNYQAWAGALAPDGGAPVVSALPIADLAAGMAAAFAVCAAAVRRLRGGGGERIDIAMADIMATWTGAMRPQAQGVDSSVRGVPGYGIFETADRRYITLGVLTEDHFWRSLCVELGLAEHANLPFAARMTRLAELQDLLSAAIRGRDRPGLVAALMAVDVPVAPVLDRSEMLELAHFAQRSVATVDPWADPAIGYPIQFERHAARRTAPPPQPDEHRGAVFHPRP
jgi:crotonobetainyl-CoA:carnitine CoA-transferase CaiB-like acyl-CoA transferase